MQLTVADLKGRIERLDRLARGLTVEGSTLSGNSAAVSLATGSFVEFAAAAGGAVFNAGSGAVTLTSCTLRRRSQRQRRPADARRGRGRDGAGR
jgi:hypothetical protein